jgi:hypothetical protein
MVPAPQEPDAGDDALEHARDVARGGAGLLGDQDEQGRAQRHEHVGADARRLARPFTLVAQGAAQQGRHEQPNQQAGGLAGFG